ncbi:MAG: hypothetical protein V1934_05825 [Methanobacteriota archaeon]
MKARLFVALVVGAMLTMSLSAMALPVYDPSVNGVVTAWQPMFSDNFDQDSGRWVYTNAAVRVNGHARLTPNATTQVGVMWFDTQVAYDFQVEFDYLIEGGNHADGMVFMFFKQQDGYVPSTGGSMGFFQYPNTPAEGYGVELDTYCNQNIGNEPYTNPPENHAYLGIIQNTPWNHLATVAEPRVRDAEAAGHHIKVNVDNKLISVYIDDMDNAILTWTGEIDRGHGGFGFGAGTGGRTDNHWIDNVEISKKVTYLVENGKVVSQVDVVQGPEEQIEDAPVHESATWTMIAGNTVLLVITIFIVLLIARGIMVRRR